jgi:hypothetical protein
LQHTHGGAGKVLRVQGTQDTAHEDVVPLEDVYDFVVTVRELVQSVHLGASWNCNFHSYVPLRNNVEDAESALDHFLNYPGFLRLAEKFGLKTLPLTSTRSVLVDAVGHVCRHTRT